LEGARRRGADRKIAAAPDEAVWAPKTRKAGSKMEPGRPVPAKQHSTFTFQSSKEESAARIGYSWAWKIGKWV